MLGFTEKYNEFIDSTYFKNLKAGIRFAIYYAAATFAVGCLGLIIGSPILIFPLAMLISHPLVWLAMGIVSAVVYKTIAKPLFHSAKGFINKTRDLTEENSKEEGVGEQKSQEHGTEEQKLKRSVSENSIFTQEGTISTQNTTLRRKVSLDSSGYATSSEDGASNRNTPIQRDRKSSGDSDYSSGSDGSINSTVNKQTRVAHYKTEGKGNCFFHAVFGEKNSSNKYEAEKAQKMREGWHKFLSQFTSLDDQRMPDPLREQMQKVFNMFLDKPGDLTGRSDDIKKLAEATKSKIKNAECEAEKLKSRAVNSLNITPNQAFSDLMEYAKVFYPDLSDDERNKKYNSDAITSSFTNNPELYRAYLEAIKNPGYYVFAEEIPILASLANITVEFYAEDIDDKGNRITRHEVLLPNQDMIKGYRRNDELWGNNKKKETIHLEGAHYERAEVVEVLPISKTESVSSLQSVLSYCPIM